MASADMAPEQVFDVPTLRYLVEDTGHDSHVLMEYRADKIASSSLLIFMNVALKRHIDQQFESDFKALAWLCTRLSEVCNLSVEAITTYLSRHMETALEAAAGQDLGDDGRLQLAVFRTITNTGADG